MNIIVVNAFNFQNSEQEHRIFKLNGDFWCLNLKSDHNVHFICFHPLKLLVFNEKFIPISVPYLYIRWLRDGEPIVDTQFPEVLPPPRITFFNNGSLQVRDVRRDDTAEYLCEVTTVTHSMETQLHAIEVQCKIHMSR